MPIHFLHPARLPTSEGLHGDGNGLYLEVRKNGSYWLFRYLWQGKQKKMFHPGSTANITLAMARDWAVDQKRKLAQNPPIDPKAERDRNTPDARPPFLKFALDCVREWTPGWVNKKHTSQWLMTISVYAEPLHNKRIDAITTADVVAALRPIWYSKEETARRLRGRLERIFKAAKHAGLRSGDNPAELDAVKAVLGQQRGKKIVEHHPALPYEKLPAFMAKLRDVDAASARALELTILTAVRTGEMLGMEWSEIDLDAGLWTIPRGTRMKNKEIEHVVPLGDRAIEILRAMRVLTGHGRYVFPGRAMASRTSEQTMSTQTMDRMLKTVLGDAAPPATVHGMRSTFQDWAGDETAHDADTIDFALHHAEGNETKAAYRRRTALQKRAVLMRDWENYCYSTFKPRPRLAVVAA
jgi:integrase